MLQKNNNKGIRIILFFVVLVSLIISIKLYFVQVVNGKSFVAKADRQYINPTEPLFDRGSIFFEDKDGVRVSTATIKSGFILSINPKLIEDDRNVFEKLSGIIEIDEEDFFMKSSKKDDPHEELKKHLDESVAKEIKSLKLKGVSLIKEKWRVYPGEALSSRTIGFLAYKDDDLSGRYGVERYYEDILNRNNENLYVNFFVEVFLNIKDSLGNESIAGQSRKQGDIILTIDPLVQKLLERKLVEIKEKWNAKDTLGVIINPKTGEIYAMGVKPNFDLNKFNKEKDASIFSNPIVENVYEMGSIIKPLTMASGLDARVVKATTEYNDKGFLIMNEARISNYDKKGRGVVNMQEVLNQSLNTGVAFVVSQLGNEKFAGYMKKFGMGEETGIDLPNESSGIINNLDSPRDLEYATASFGQGIALTPIMTVRALSALANDGKLVTPHVMKEIEYKLGYTRKFNDSYSRDLEPVIKERASNEITRMLVKVVDEALLGGTVKLDRYSIAAKTGTAQIANLEDGGYYKDKFLHSFFGYFPAYNPEFLIFLMTIEPHGVRYASHTLTSPFMDIVKFLINYYEIPPDR